LGIGGPVDPGRALPVIRAEVGKQRPLDKARLREITKTVELIVVPQPVLDGVVSGPHAVTSRLHRNQCKMHNFLEVGFSSMKPHNYLIMYQIGTQGLHEKQGVSK